MTWPRPATLQLLSAVLSDSEANFKLNHVTISPQSDRTIFGPASVFSATWSTTCRCWWLLVAPGGCWWLLVAAGGDTGTRELASWATQLLAAVLPTSARAEKRMLAGEMLYSMLVQVGVVQLSYVVTLSEQEQHA